MSTWQHTGSLTGDKQLWMPKLADDETGALLEMKHIYL